MIILDTNILLAAQRSDHPQHSDARPWLEQLLKSEELFGVPSTVWASFLRLTTNRRIFLTPTPIEEAFQFVTTVANCPNCVNAEPGPRHLEVLSKVCVETEVTGDLVPDAVIATLASEHGAAIASFDRDFARFEGLRWIRPPAADRHP